MNSAAWLAANNCYLAASLHWLRLRLKQRLPAGPARVSINAPLSATNTSTNTSTNTAAQIATHSSPSTAPITTATARPTPTSAVLSMAVPGLAQARSWFSQRARVGVSVPAAAAARARATPVDPASRETSALQVNPASPATPATPGRSASSLACAHRSADALHQAAAARDAAARIDPLPALLKLAARFGLSPFERDVLLLCVAAELDADIGALFGAVQGGAAHAHPTFGLAFYLLDEPAWDALAPSRPLRGMGLVEISQPAATPLTASALRADERIVNYVKGLNELDARLALLLVPVLVPDTSGLAASQQAQVNEILWHLRHATADAAQAAGATMGQATSDLTRSTTGTITNDPADATADATTDATTHAKTYDITRSTPTHVTGVARITRVSQFPQGHQVGPTAHAQPSQPSEPNPGPRASPPAALHPTERQDVPDRLGSSHLAGLPTLLSLPAFQLQGNDSASKLAVAGAVCAGVARQLYRLNVDALPPSRAETENLARLWQRELALLPVALYVESQALDSGGASPHAQAALSWWLAQPLGLVFVDVRDALPTTAPPSHVVEVRRPTAVEQCAAWRCALAPSWPAEAAADSARLLAGQFDLGLSDILLAAQYGEPSLRVATLSEVWDASRRLTRARLDVLAQRVEPRATWDDLVLCAESLGLLHQITTQMRNRYQVYEDWGFAARSARGLGISALFTGASGTGKTMAAEVIANALQLNLYRIDLSTVVSAAIGETEQTLRRLFDAAEQGGAILFFAEADALLGERGQGHDSHESHESHESHHRSTGPEINALLQRMNSFSGLSILATHPNSALDPAFLGRLRFAVHFPFPGRAEREEIWRKAWPAEVPCEGLDFERLARASVCGGNIHNIALNAAFLAAQRGSPVRMPLLMAALRTELRKLGQPFDEAELR